MKKLFLLIMCVLLSVMLCSCNDSEATRDQTPTEAVTQGDVTTQDADAIVGTWVCDDISDECYFIFEENGDAFAKWGTSTVYGYFDYDDETGIYDIDVPNFLYNEYEAYFGGDVMTLQSDESKYVFEKATMPEIIIKTPDNLAIDTSLFGDWQSEDSYECFRFNSDTTAVITDMYNYATIDCKYSCNNGVVTMYYMASATQDGSRELEYSINNGILTINGYEYEKVSE